MTRRLSIWLCLIAIAGFVAHPAFAAVQNVKVSGDITASAVSRNNLDLNKLGDRPDSGATTRSDNERDLLSISRVRIDADLTDNVSTTVRLLNERNWNGDSTTADQNNRNIGLNAPNATNIAAGNDEKEISIDLAYVTLRDFLNVQEAPITLTIGRQNLRFGNGWIVGDPDTNGIALNSALAEGDLSARKSFDAIRATVDYKPLVLDLVFAKVAENSNVLNDDTTLYGGNLAYELDPATTLEGFFFSKVRGTQAAAVTNLDNGGTTGFLTGTGNTIDNRTDIVNTLGVRAVNGSIKNLILDAQVAWQFGTYNPKFDPNARWISATNKAETSPRSAWGTEVIANYNLKDVEAIAKWQPTITGVYTYLSGANRDKVDAATYKGWDAMFEDQTFGHLINAVMGFSNAHLVGAVLTAKPMDSVTARLDYVASWLAKRVVDGRMSILSGVATAQQYMMAHKAFVGQELDLTLTYDYTEDVQFSLLGGIFLPTKAINGLGEQYSSNNSQAYAGTPATELIGSMKVTF